MKILFGSQFYSPSIGGVQEVMRRLAEALVKNGHEVTIATSTSHERNFDTLNGVKIEEFEISGNYVSGMSGELDAYQNFVLEGNFDLIMMMAAQQWAFDALWPILDKFSKTRTVFIPCGFSGFYDPAYAQYFSEMPEILRKIDHLVFHSTNYRDINFAKEHGINSFSVIPCGASEEHFDSATDHEFRARHNISENSFLFLTVGTFTGLKGHLEIVMAFERLVLPIEKTATLILNGNVLPPFGGGAGGMFRKLIQILRAHGAIYAFKTVWSKALGSRVTPQKISDKINLRRKNKQVLVTDFERPELTQAFLNSDLFVFASNIEYSPLVLFETAAAGTPFLSVTVGNTPEIAGWTGAGIICPSHVDSQGFTRVDVDVLATQMADTMEQTDRLSKLGNTGRDTWKKSLTWTAIASRYEALFVQLVDGTTK